MSDSHRKQYEKTLNELRQHYATRDLGQKMVDELFRQNPEVSTFFDGVVIEDFTSRKFNLISEHVYDSIVSPEYAQYNMVSEIYRHRYNRIVDVEYYYIIIDCFCKVVRECVGSDWSKEENMLWYEIEQAAKHTVQLANEELSSL